jgi:hypothetical protein
LKKDFNRFTAKRQTHSLRASAVSRGAALRAWYLAFGIWFLAFGSYFFGSRLNHPKTDPVEFTARNHSSRDPGTSGEAEHAPSRAELGAIRFAMEMEFLAVWSEATKMKP